MNKKKQLLKKENFIKSDGIDFEPDESANDIDDIGTEPVEEKSDELSSEDDQNNYDSFGGSDDSTKFD